MQKSFNEEWEAIHSTQEWGTYPSEHVIRFIARNYYKTERDKVKILDFGCGSGRDTKYFLEKGYQVAATDGSAELCRLAGSFTSWCSDSHSYWQLLRNYTAFCTISS